MPAKNSIKDYIENGYYHLYNRGVEKRDIFLDAQDFAVFLSYLKTYLLPKDIVKLNSIVDSKESTIGEKDKALKELKLKNYYDNIDLLCYCLMPNHFHFLVKQTEPNAIDSFVNALSTRYVMYFNRKYKRVGPLYQGVYKAVLITSEAQLLHLSRYIHLNPLTASGLPFSKWQEVTCPFSLPEYLETRRCEWLKPQIILDYFNKASPNDSYINFMAQSQEGEFIAPFSLDINDE